MAEILVLRRNSWIDKGEAATRARLGDDRWIARVSKKHDIVEAQPDRFYHAPDNPTGHGWDHAKFYVIRIAGLTVTKAEPYTRPAMDGRRMAVRHKFNLDVDNVPTAVKNALRDTGIYDTDLDTIKAFFKTRDISWRP